MVIEFENDNGTLDAIIKGIVVSIASNPTEMRAAEVVLDSIFADLPCRVGEVQKELLCNIKD